MFGHIKGQNLNLAEMRLANECIGLKQEAGVVDVRHVVLKLNEARGLVPNHKAEALVRDVTRCYDWLSAKETTEINRLGYLGWKINSAMCNVIESNFALEKELKALKE